MTTVSSSTMGPLIRVSEPCYGVPQVPLFPGVFYPDTAFVKALLRVVMARPELQPGCRVLVLGTGAGYEAAVIAKQIGMTVHATDINGEAVANTAATAAMAGVTHLVQTWVSDGFEEIRGYYDLILFNAPLAIAQGQPDPNTLDPGGKLLTRILQQLPEHLAPKGALYLMSFPDIGAYLCASLTNEVLETFEGGEYPYCFSFAIHRVILNP